MILRKGIRIRLSNNGDPPPHHFVSGSSPPFQWGVNGKKLGDLLDEDAAVDACWRRFREHALVPEAGALVVEVGMVHSGAEVATLECRNGRRVGYLVEWLMQGWEHEPEAAIEEMAGHYRSRELAAGR